jgi:hypothetical protein
MFPVKSHSSTRLDSNKHLWFPVGDEVAFKVQNNLTRSVWIGRVAIILASVSVEDCSSTIYAMSLLSVRDLPS